MTLCSSDSLHKHLCNGELPRSFRTRGGQDLPVRMCRRLSSNPPLLVGASSPRQGNLAASKPGPVRSEKAGSWGGAGASAVELLARRVVCGEATLAMDQPAGLQVDYIFRGVEHAVRVVVSGQVLELEVEDRMTADQWRGEFDASFIEDLTHKTGNFKQFNIFCNMLESALTQSSESVTLDLLTYTDLESLRNRKMGGRPGPLASRSAQLNSKRYLILIYSVEFDRIHYPLPLPYQGKPDPVVLQGIIRSLKQELGRLRGLDGQDARDTRETEIWHLREQVSRLASEKRELEAQLERKGDLVERKGVAQLVGIWRRTPPVPPPRAREDRASSSRERSTSRGRGATRSSSRESGRGGRSRGRPARPSPSPTGSRVPRFDPTAFVKAKEKKQREIKMKQQQQRNRLGSGGSGDGPSISWSRQARPPAAVSGRGDAANRSRNRSSSVDSFRSRCSSAGSCSELEDFSESLPKGVHHRGKPSSPTPWGGSSTKPTPLERSRHQRCLTSSGGWVPMKEYSSDHQAADMAEIDARLKALQEYMNRLDTRS
ncbi:PREDICTED: coiled-coil domain-containing protein 61 [Odobenus rosmarus divergens]|uniref:Centrosomal protein CCDC61 n=1 Tax=Odobenus rosmarus divergens TaxID=9708 RepID=A0A9B0LP58_ODORO